MPGNLPQYVARTFTEGLLYGFYLVTVCYANRWLLFADDGWKLRKNVNWSMVIVTNLLAAMEMAGVAIGVEGPMREVAFVQLGNLPSKYIAPVWESIVGCTLSDAIALLADTVLMYRVWITYGRKTWIMYFPLFLWLGGFVCTVLQLFLQLKAIHNPNFGPYKWANVNMTIGPGIVLIPFWGSTIALNAYCTVALIWRIWKSSKRDENSTVPKQLQFLVRILAESGMLYLAISISHFTIWFTHNDIGVLFLGAMNTILIGIAFNLIIIRTAQNRSEQEEKIFGAGNLTTMAFNSKSMAISAYNETSIETDPTIYRTHDSEGSF